ncbi:MAG: rRNA maturation RNase YbeY [Solobacterium sp.]|nr:rRNA maturation RNase YbeY [Solobacterium sp.]
MELSIYNRTNLDVSSYEALFQKIAKRTEKVLDLPNDHTLSVTFVRSRTIHIINREYRGIDRPTDVITFAALDDRSGFETDEELLDLGDLFINLDYAKKQAREYGHSMEREVGFLFTHGLLHTLGYDHMDPSEERVMFDLQDEILDPIVKRNSK